MKIKVCGIVDVDQILALDDLAIDFIGINFYVQSKRYFKGCEKLSNLSLRTAKLVGVFVDPEMDVVLHAADKHQLSYIQLHGSESPQFCNALANRGLNVIKVFDGNHIPEYEIMKLYNACTFFIVDSGLSDLAGHGKKFDWAYLHGVGITKPWMVAGGIKEEHAGELITLSALPLMMGCDINSGFELMPAKKDIRAISRFKNQLYANTL